MDTSAPRLRYVCLPGAGFTGSTLLSFLLNAHPQCASVGAAAAQFEGARGFACSCEKPLLACDFWARVVARMQALGVQYSLERKPLETTYRLSASRPLDVLLIRSLRSDALNALRDALVLRLPPVRRRLAHIDRVNHVLARAVLEVTGKSVFVDSSRDPLRTKLLARAPGIDLWVIHLVRDVRANAASIMKNHGITDAARAARIWCTANLEAERVRRCVPPERHLRLRYEELCSDLQGTLDRIADFLGVPRAEAPADFRASEHHILGNRMRLGGDGRVRPDTSWRGRLSAAQLEQIAREAGGTNRHFGFDWPPDA